jgi:chemotaxis protein CheX
MSTLLPIEIHPTDVAQIVEAVFTTMLNMETVVIGDPWFPGSARLTSTVHLAGDWNGAVLLECSQAQASRFTSRFLSKDPSEPVDYVVHDVLGELANMIGGNLKSVLSKQIRISMPSVVDGSDYSMRSGAAPFPERLSFQCSEGVFWVTVLTIPS